MKIMALDQATSVSGMAVFDGTTLMRTQALSYHKIKEADKRKIAMCLGILHELDEEMPDKVVLEDVSFQKNAASLIDLARLQGSILGWCWLHQKDVSIYKPSAWRKLLGFKQGAAVKREALKKQAKEFVKEHYELEVSEDEADAVCIGCAYAVSQENKEAVQ